MAKLDFFFVIFQKQFVLNQNELTSIDSFKVFLGNYY